MNCESITYRLSVATRMTIVLGCVAVLPFSGNFTSQIRATQKDQVKTADKAKTTKTKTTESSLLLNDPKLVEIKKANSEKYAGGAPLKTDPELEDRLKRAQQFANQANYRNATLLWQFVLKGSGDSLYTRDGETYFSLSREVERIIRALPPEGLRTYRVTADGEAQAVMAKAKDPNDESALATVVDQFFLSSLGDEAAFQLGCLALDNFDFVGASRLFTKILEEYPDPTVDLSEVYVRLAVAAAQIGDEKSAAEAIAASKEKMTANSTEIVELVSKSIGSIKGTSQTIEANSWEMPFGNAKRLGVMPAPPELATETDLTWDWTYEFDISLPGGSNGGTGNRAVITRGLGGFSPAQQQTESTNRKTLLSRWKSSKMTPAGQLLISKDRVIFKTRNDLAAWQPSRPEKDPIWRSLWLNRFEVDATTDLLSKQAGYNNRGGSKTGRPSAENDVFFLGDRIHHSMSVIDGVVYSIEGKNYGRYASKAPKAIRAPVTGNVWNVQPRRGRTNFITAYDLETGRLIWDRSAAEPDPNADPEEVQNIDEVGFMAAPVAFGNLLIAPVTEGGAIWIYGMDKSNGGKTVWKTYLCDEPSGGCEPWSVIDLAVEGRDIYVGSGTGAIFALDAVSGAIRFARRYQRSVPKTVNQNRGYGNAHKIDMKGWLNDTVIPYGNGLVVMSSDHDWLFSLDRRTGKELWRAPRLPFDDDLTQKSYCLGVYNGMLYVAAPQSVICYELEGDGRLKWVYSFEDAERSYGRGFVSSNGVYIPIEDSIARLDLNSGEVIKRVGVKLGDNEPVGNLFCDGNRFWMMNLNRVYALTSLSQRLTSLDALIAKGDERALFDRMNLYGDLKEYNKAFADLSAYIGKKLDANKPEEEVAAELFRGALETDLVGEKPKELVELLLSYRESNKFSVETLTKNKATIQSIIANRIDKDPENLISIGINATRLLGDFRFQFKLAQKIREVSTEAQRSELDEISGDVNKSSAFIALPALAKLSDDKAVEKLESFLGSTDERVAFIAAKELIGRKQKSALPRLLELAEGKDKMVRTFSLATLRSTTGQYFQLAEGASDEMRKVSLDKWRNWIDKESEKAELNPIPANSLKLNRLIYVQSSKQTVLEVSTNDPDKVLWSEKISGAVCACGTIDGTILVGTRNNKILVYPPPKQGEEKRTKSDSFSISGLPQSIQVLENGNYLVALQNTNLACIEIDKKGNTVWSYKSDRSEYCRNAKRLENGNTLLTFYQSKRILEVDTAGKTVWTLNTKYYPYSAERLPNNNTLVALQATTNSVVEYDSNSTVVWQVSVSSPKRATRLEDGSTLVGTNLGLLKYDIKKKKTWSQKVRSPVSDLSTH